MNQKETESLQSDLDLLIKLGTSVKAPIDALMTMLIAKLYEGDAIEMVEKATALLKQTPDGPHNAGKTEMPTHWSDETRNAVITATALVDYAMHKSLEVAKHAVKTGVDKLSREDRLMIAAATNNARLITIPYQDMAIEIARVAGQPIPQDVIDEHYIKMKEVLEKHDQRVAASPVADTSALADLVSEFGALGKVK